ncbi:MAG: hypothetical protein BAJALOKI3v1_20041 [Promethearchaeota archaeon]|nr:MAG: hypothetical protein BAJALOKI3v1_20041 [Candidatus Lokiarchaeota archaeon]
MCKFKHYDSQKIEEGYKISKESRDNSFEVISRGDFIPFIYIFRD